MFEIGERVNALITKNFNLIEVTYKGAFSAELSEEINETETNKFDHF